MQFMGILTHYIVRVLDEGVILDMNLFLRFDGTMVQTLIESLFLKTF